MAGNHCSLPGNRTHHMRHNDVIYLRINELPPLLKDDNGPLILALFNWMGPPCLTAVRKKLKVRSIVEFNYIVITLSVGAGSHIRQ